MQVSSAGVQPGEEQALRRRLRHMEARQSSVQRCGLVAAAQAGLQEGVRAAQTQLNAVLAEEQAHADALAGDCADLACSASAEQLARVLLMWCSQVTCTAEQSIPVTSETPTVPALCAQVCRMSLG